MYTNVNHIVLFIYTLVFDTSDRYKYGHSWRGLQSFYTERLKHIMIHCVCWYNDYCLSIILFPRNNFHIVKPRLQNENLIMYRRYSPIHVSWHYLYKNPYFLGTYLEIHDFMNIIDLFCHCKKTLGLIKGWLRWS